MKKLLLLFHFSFYILHSAFAQDSCTLRISLLTCAPGEELYSTFGHTALRVQDFSNSTDEVYNYGTFEFGPDFYAKFIRGQLNYFLSVENFNDFFYQYQMQNRSIQEQELQLSCAEKQKLLYALNNNAKEENKYYLYDFLFDNCTTRAGMMLEKNTSATVVYKNILSKETPTFRHLIHSYLDAGHQYWSKLGIDILLGAKLDRKVSNKEAMFLPDYLLKGFDSASLKGQPLVNKTQTILGMRKSWNGISTSSLLVPFFVFSFLLILIVAFTLIKTKWAAKVVSIFDFLFFFVLGLAGLLLLFMWFGTDHTTTQNNYNLLWALPIHAVAAFFIGSKKKWVSQYFRVVASISLLLLLVWFFLPQQMNNALIPVVFLIILRSWDLSKKKDYARETHHHQRQKTLL